MTVSFPDSMKNLVERIGRLPGIGPKTAQRLAFHILKSSRQEADGLAKAIITMKESVRFCTICNNLSDEEICKVCADPARNKSIICVVEEPKDIIAIEKAGSYEGVYHVLLGSLSPLDGIGPDDLKIKELVERIKREKPAEVIIATDFNTEGEATALYLVKELSPAGVKVTRVAYGIPVGSSLEYADGATIFKAFEGRRRL
jgi:recombination protein RecR